MQFQEGMAHSNPLLLKLNIIKLPYKMKIENCVLNSKHANCKLPPIFSNWLNISGSANNYKVLLLLKDLSEVLVFIQLLKFIQKRCFH